MIEVRKFVDVFIVGAGPAGLYASYICSLLAIDYLVVESLSVPGGQCTALYAEKDVYGVPGFDGCKAKDFINKLSGQCLRDRRRVLFSHKVERILRLEDGNFEITLQNLDSKEYFPTSFFILHSFAQSTDRTLEYFEGRKGKRNLKE